MKKIKSIEFPNTATSIDAMIYTVDKGCDEIKKITKAGEMANVAWFEVWKDGDIIAEIKESVCNIYYNQTTH